MKRCDGCQIGEKGAETNDPVIALASSKTNSTNSLTCQFVVV